ncbi:MAG: T9SS type A sorting domain-containing protein, partial [Flavobacteriales bacterium]|nr:T9SS type A sorting domain-containing protein [Flavobacteriales bacterium]
EEVICFHDHNGELIFEDPLPESFFGISGTFYTNYENCSWEITNVGILESTTEEISIFPNPATDRLYLENCGLIDQVVIRSLNGAVVMERKSPRGDFLDISSISAGIYSIAIVVENVQRKPSILVIQP